MASRMRLSLARGRPPVLSQQSLLHKSYHAQPSFSRNINTNVLSSGPKPPPFRLPSSWPVIAPLILLGTGSIAMVIWYFSSNEFLDAGFPPRAAEAFRIASVAADDWQLRHAIRYYRTGIEITIAHGISPFDERILRIKGKLMDAIKKDGDVGGEREVLEDIKDQALQEIKSGNVKDRGRLVALAVQASLSLANVHPSQWFA